MPFFFFPLPKVPCNATTTCNGHGSCTNHGDCQCDNGFYTANCSGKLSLNYSIIKIFIFWKSKCFAWIVECDAAQNCSGQGICGPDGTCQCDNGFYAANCSGKLSLNYSIIKIFFEINALLE